MKLFNREKLYNDAHISLLMPFKDDCVYLPVMLKSIMNQKFKLNIHYTLIIVDDSTEQESLEYIERLPRKYDWIKIVRGNHTGVSDALNLGLNYISTDYFIQVDSDNYLYPNFIETLYKYIRKTNADVVTCCNEAFTNNIHEKGRRWHPKGQIYPLMITENCVGDACAIYDTKSIKECSGFPNTPKRVPVDWIMWNKLTSLGYKIEVCPKYLFKYRIRNDSHSSNLDYDTCVKLNRGFYE